MNNKLKEVAVGYLRLSRDDGEYTESTSITNQRKIILEFAEQNGLTISDWYIDDGVSGYTIDRPEFNRLMDDLNNDKVHTVIAKDLSRLGRNNAKVNLFLDNMYEVGKRVIAIGDNYDTYNEHSMDMAGITTWLNDKYIRDVSRKIRTSIQTMQKEGKWICSMPYGYMLDPIRKGKYYPDPMCSHYVKKIFDMYISGMGVATIVKQLNSDNIPTYSTIKRQRMEHTGKTSKLRTINRWTTTTIKNMLTNEFYIGTLTQRKSKARAINGKRINVDKSEQYRYENAHEPLIDKYTFNLVQEIIKKRSNTPYRGVRVKNRKNLFVGLMRCVDCGSRMTSIGNSDNTRYVCDNYNRYGKKYCSRHVTREYDVKDSLIYLLEHCRDNLSNVLKDIDIILKKDYNLANPNNTIDILQKKLTKVKNEVFGLMQQKAIETMDNPSMAEMINDMYKEMMDRKYKEIATLERQIEDQKINIDETANIKDNLKNTLDIINDVINTKDITKKQVQMLVDHIIVYDDGGIDIYLKGDLHEICNNHVHIAKCKIDIMLEQTVIEILKNPTHVYPSTIWETLKNEYGHNIGYTKFRQLVFNHIVDIGAFKPLGTRRGLQLIISKEELYDSLKLNTVDKTSRSCIDNNVTIENIKRISRLGNKLKSNKKHLF